MKKLALYIAIFIFTISVLFAQESQDVEKKKETDTTKTGKVFKNDSTADSTVFRGRGMGHGRGKGRQHGKKDRFVDEDGDGINDNRCKGMGLCKGKKKGKRCKKK